MTAAVLRRIRLKDYRSIASCDLRLEPLTFLVGPNGSGKSNIVDALRFVRDALDVSVEYALRERGGIGEVRRRSRGRPRSFAIHVTMQVPGGKRASWEVEIASSRGGDFEVAREACLVDDLGAYRVRRGQIEKLDLWLDQTSEAIHIDEAFLRRTARANRRTLFLSNPFLPFFFFFQPLRMMEFFNPAPNVLRQHQRPLPSARLLGDGSNVASVFRRLVREQPNAVERILECLARIVPGIQGVTVKQVEGREVLKFTQEAGGEHAWSFPADGMSDGTLRAFGVLVALFHAADESRSLLGLEEPEVGLHPAATRILFDALCEAAESRQLLVTTHSPDLLDSEDVPIESIRSVTLRDGQTVVGTVDAALRQVLRDRLYTAGELLSQGQLGGERVATGE